MHSSLQALLINAVESAANSIMITDRTGHIVWVNEACCRLSGYTNDELLGKTPGLLNSGKQSPSFYRDLWQTILSGQPWQGELVEQRRDGVLFTVSQVITPLHDEQGAVSHFLAIQNDISADDRERRKVRHLAYHDALTGLPNRALFLDKLNESIAQAQADKLMAVMFIDLDHFKAINDTLGHAAGDRVLVAVADRLSAAVRKSDIVARVSGDEFTILVTSIDDSAVVAALAQKLVTSIARPFVIDGQTVHSGASIGISLFRQHGDTGATLLAHADAAMYSVKNASRNGYSFYQPPTDK